MRIVHVVRQYKPSVGGLEDAVQNLVLQLSTLPNVSVKIVTLDRLFGNLHTHLPSMEYIDGIEVTRIGFFGSRRYPIALSILRAIQDADIVHVHGIDYFFDFLALTKFIHRKKLIASTHGGFFHTNYARVFKRFFFKTITRVSASCYDAILCSSENDYLNFSKLHLSNLHIVENGVDVMKWSDLASPLLKRTIISIGRWTKHKNIESLFYLMKELRLLNPNWKLIIVGVKGDYDINHLLNLRMQYGLSKNVEIFEGLSTQEIGKKITEASYFASNSHYEGFGISLIEALSAGLIPIISDIAPFLKVFKKIQSGHLIKANAIRETAIEINYSYSRSSRSSKPLKLDLIHVANEYNWNSIGSIFLKYYNAIGNRASK